VRVETKQLGATGATVGFVLTVASGGAIVPQAASGGTGSALESDYDNGNASPITQGQVVYISGNDEVDLATATADNGLARVIGFVKDASISSAATGAIHTAGAVIAKLVTSLTVNPNDEIFLSTTPGSCTNVAPTAVGNIRQSLGFIKNVLTYDGSGDLLVELQLVIGSKAVV
jgi:hypothetical protein